jgi:hypothetical protein
MPLCTTRPFAVLSVGLDNCDLVVIEVENLVDRLVDLRVQPPDLFGMCPWRSA